jgi:hypothetical protein
MEYDNASVKVMRSYDYCHFEVVLGRDNGQPLNKYDVDEMRKGAARLVDKAVEQYKIMKKFLIEKSETGHDYNRLSKIVAGYLKEQPQRSEWTPEQKAVEKRLRDLDFYRSLEYDYQDDFDPEKPENEYDDLPY